MSVETVFIFPTKVIIYLLHTSMETSDYARPDCHQIAIIRVGDPSRRPVSGLADQEGGRSRDTIELGEQSPGI